MHKNYWLYQEDNLFAAHVYVFSDGYMDISFYAEHIPSKTHKDLHINVDYGEYMDAFDLFAGLYDVALSSNDIRQINELWTRISKDFNF